MRLMLMKQIAFTSAALRQWRKLSPDVRNQIDGKLNTFAEIGAGDLKKLKGRDGMRLRVGDWRVIFTIDEAIITVHAVGHCREIYD
jgi:mRNA interferase RelE/StbE